MSITPFNNEFIKAHPQNSWEYRITGILTTGRRFPAIYTRSYLYARSINLYRGTKWQRPYDLHSDAVGKWQVVK